jgi:hypothetical protein
VRPLQEMFMGKSDQASVQWMIGNLHAFIIASVLSGLDVVRIEVDVQKVLQGLCIAKNNTGRQGRGDATFTLQLQVRRRDISGLRLEKSSYGVFI